MSPQGPVWAKRNEGGPDEAALSFTSGWDVAPRPAADARLAFWDLHTNAAHLVMLHETGILGRADASALARALRTLRSRPPGDILRPECEDIHMSIEAALTEIVGPAAGRIHTARSRNDQVATDMRLWLRDAVGRLHDDALSAARALADHALDHRATVCPGFTHVQPAMIATWGYWCMAHVAPLERAARQLATLFHDLQECPLGGAAGFGTSWPIDRDLTASLLGFGRPTPNGLDAIGNRGESEARFAFIAAELMAALARVAQDIILLSSPPRQWLRLPDSHVTGSSIMPQKRNPDFCEVAIGRANVARSLAGALLSIPPALPGGYHRALQWTKYLVFDAADNVEGACEVFAGAFAGMTVDTAAMREGCATGFLNAADLADLLSRARALTFREGYRLAGEITRRCDGVGRITIEATNARLREAAIEPLTEAEFATIDDPSALLEQRRHVGSPAPSQTEQAHAAFVARLAAGSPIDDARRNVTESFTRLWERIDALAAEPG